MSSFLDAARAGIHPKRSPINIDTLTAIMTELKLTTLLILSLIHI
ncbi:hypothetical protein JMUB7536_27810 [Staphylococcus aureus]